MLTRCTNPRRKQWHNYGGRGVTICERWDSFENFLADMGEPPTVKHQLDRKDNDGNYEPENCRWATRKEQMRNTSKNRLIEFNGRIECIAEWSSITGIKPRVLSDRLKRGWSSEKVLTTPTKHTKEKQCEYSLSS